MLTSRRSDFKQIAAGWRSEVQVASPNNLHEPHGVRAPCNAAAQLFTSEGRPAAGGTSAYLHENYKRGAATTLAADRRALGKCDTPTTGISTGRAGISKPCAEFQPCQVDRRRGDPRSPIRRRFWSAPSGEKTDNSIFPTFQQLTIC